MKCYQNLISSYVMKYQHVKRQVASFIFGDQKSPNITKKSFNLTW